MQPHEDYNVVDIGSHFGADLDFRRKSGQMGKILDLSATSYTSVVVHVPQMRTGRPAICLSYEGMKERAPQTRSMHRHRMLTISLADLRDSAVHLRLDDCVIWRIGRSGLISIAERDSLGKTY